MKKKLALTLALSVAYPCFASAAGYMTGNMLQEVCESEDTLSQLLCTGYMQGINDSHFTTQGWDKEATYYCKPDNVTAGQLMKITKKYMANNPGKLDWAASSLVLNALEGAFPCE